MSVFGVQLASLAHPFLWRSLITVVVLAVLGLLLRHLRNDVAREVGARSMIERRGAYVWRRNLYVGLGGLALLWIWASSIAGAALSLAAVAGAFLLVSKEFLANLLGHVYFLAVRPFQVGDFVELAGVRGRVLDIHVLAVTVTETVASNQVTGRTVALPSSLLLTTPVRNFSSTGDYVVTVTPIVLPRNADLLREETLLLDAAAEVCESWRRQADEHLKALEGRRLVDLPSAEPRVLFDFSDPKAVVANVRFVAPTERRVVAEQGILRAYLLKRGGGSALARAEESE